MTIGPHLRPGAFASVALGGAVGAALRHATGVLIGFELGGFPWPTLLVNLLGSLLLGAVAVAPLHGEAALRLFLATGLLGSFTTFSAFSVETWALVDDGRLGLALVYASLSLVAGLVAAAGGLAAGRCLWQREEVRA